MLLQLYILKNDIAIRVPQCYGLARFAGCVEFCMFPWQAHSTAVIFTLHGKYSHLFARIVFSRSVSVHRFETVPGSVFAVWYY